MANDYFLSTAQMVLGQVFEAAGYSLLSRPVQWSGGLYQFQRREPGAVLQVAFQVLSHPEHDSRFQVSLERRPVAGEAVRITLPRLLWDRFTVQVLSSPEHWWTFRDQRELADGLLEAGKLLAGYGLPWLDGSLPG